MTYLNVEDLSKSFDGHPVLRGVGFSLERGSLLALLGPSGSGKSTLLRILCGFERADAGAVAIDGQCVEGPAFVTPEQRKVGYVPQEGALFPHLTVAENILFGLGRADRRAGRRVAELLDIVGLPFSYAERYPQSLSGGQQQRVALARALAPRPALIMLDEPFSALDTALRVETRQALVDALRAEQATAVLVTHDQSEALSTGDQVAVLLHGSLAQIGTPEVVYAYPRNAGIASFVGEAVLLPGTVRHGEVDCELGRLPLALPVPDGPAQAMIRPEQVRLVERADVAAGGVLAVAERVSFFGHDARVDMRLSATGRRVPVRISGRRVPRVGEAFGVCVEGPVVAYAA
jgi:iron(III) transport system ATP-binding protein